MKQRQKRYGRLDKTIRHIAKFITDRKKIECCMSVFAENEDELLFFGCAAEEADGENGHVIFGSAGPVQGFF